MVSLLLWFYYATLLGASILPASRSPPTSPPQAPASPVITPALGSIAGSRDYNAALIEQFSFNAPSSLATTSDNDDTTRTASSEIQLQDLTLSTIALAVTVDGFVHGINRETGQWLWTLHDDNGAALGGYSKDERDSRSKAGAGLGGGALVKGVGRKKRGKSSNSSAPSRSSSPNVTHPGDDVKTIDEYAGDAVTDEEEEEDEVYIIEPHSAGDIYLYSRSPSPGSLQKLPLSMTQLVALSPFTFPSDSSRMFAGRKETKLVGVDLKSGRLVGVFGSGAGWCEWDERSQGRVRTDEECDEDIQRRPEDLLYIARTEYHLSIYSKTPYALLQTLTYTTYSSSSLTSSLQSRWTATPDSRYLQPMHDGSLICFLSGVPGLQWTVAFDVPVVAVFDIALTKATKGENVQPIMFEQPHPRPVEGLPVAFDKTQSLPETTFIGRVEGGLFAMSRDHFPLVAFAPVSGAEKDVISGNRSNNRPASSRDSDEDSDEEYQKKSGKANCRGLECLVGAHRLQPSAVVPSDHLIEGGPERLGIEAPPSTTSSSSSSIPITPTNPDASPPLPNRSVLASIYRPVKRFSTGNSAVLISIILAIIGTLYVRGLWTTRIKLAVNDEAPVKSLSKSWSKKSEAKRLKRSSKSTPLNVISSNPSSPLITIIPLQPILPTTVTLVDSPAFPSNPNNLSSSPILREVSKDLPPLPAVVGEDDDMFDVDSDGDNVLGETPRRKGKRKRGKKTKKNKLTEDSVGVELFPEEPELVQVQLESLSLVDVDVDEAMEVDEAAAVDPRLIGSLSVSETILGYGSHGTIVLRGEFQGRAVAVKRLLKDFVTIATHEVALLQESDDHPNVIRYFCKEQRGTFLYIALELCPASLFELIDQPLSFPDLAKDLDPKKALRQITSGIRHLHKLKIVHRDIKPQNILVARSQHAGSGVRMLISDFGLCKKLDMDESSFQQTVDHAAGSFGYRAPEVLRGHVDPNDGTGSSSTTGSSSMGSRSPMGNKDPSMRLTRSLDIFSLGCIFYYVLTGGEHPFGGRYEREMNILLGKASLERLDGLGEEALEVQDAITKMVATDPRERPSAESVLLHPFFWNAQKRLLFICDASDRFEIMERDPPESTLIALEESSTTIVGDDWSKAIDRTLLDNLGKYRKYDGKSVRDLLRVLRNKKHHYQDLPENVRKNLGDLPGGFLSYFTARFPRLLLHVFDVVADHLSEEAMFKSTFSIAEDEQ